LFRALLLAVWHDLSDGRTTEALEDRASSRRFCEFARTEVTPERTAFVRFRRELLRHDLDQILFDLVTAQLQRRVVQVKAGTLVDESVVGAAREDDAEASWAGHRSTRHPLEGLPELLEFYHLIQNLQRIPGLRQPRQTIRQR